MQNVKVLNPTRKKASKQGWNINEGLNSTFTIFSLSVSSSHFKTYSHNSEYINIFIPMYIHCIKSKSAIGTGFIVLYCSLASNFEFQMGFNECNVQCD